MPYIGDLIGYSCLYMAGSQGLSAKAQVANAISMRRRKGTFSMIDEIVRYATGWDSMAIEYFRRLAITENLNHPLTQSSSLPDLRQWYKVLDLNSPSSSLPHNAEIRTASSGRGRYNLSSLGIFIWRLGSYPITGSDCCRVDEHRFMFNPLGCNVQLFARPERTADPPILPLPISREMLYLDAKRYFGNGKSISLHICYFTEDGASHEIEVDYSSIEACDLSDLLDKKGIVKGWANMPVSRIAIDPVLGRIAFPRSMNLESVRAGFCYGFSADTGGGEYSRIDSFEIQSENKIFVLKTKANASEDVEDDLTLIENAINKLFEMKADGSIPKEGIVEIIDSSRYILRNLNKDHLQLDSFLGKKIEIRAAEGCRPVLDGSILIKGSGGEVSLNGLVLTGGDLTASNRLSRLKVAHCTIVPGLSLASDGQPQALQSPSIKVDFDDPGSEVRLEIEKCIVGPLRLPEDGAELAVTDSIIDSPGRGKGAREYPVLVSGAIDETAFGIGPGALSITIAGKGPFRVALSRVTRDLEAVRLELERALKSADSSQAFSMARVARSDRRLIIIPGVPGEVVVEATRRSNLAGVLKLDANHSCRSRSLLGGIISFPLKIKATSASFNIITSNGSALRIRMGGVPSDSQEAAAMIQAAMSARKDLSDMIAASAGDRLVIVRAGEGDVPRLEPATKNNTTLKKLGLEIDLPAIGGLDGGTGPDMSIERSTVLGVVRVKKIVQSKLTIFSDPVYVTQRQEGSACSCFIPQGSRTPRRSECQPKDDDSWDQGLRFTSTRYSEPGYGQLSRICTQGILQGDGNGEMGAFHQLGQLQREVNLRAVLGEHMRFCMDWGLFFMT